MLRLAHNPHLGAAFLGEHVGEQVPPGPLPVAARGVEHPPGTRRDERVGVDLPVRVGQRDPDLPTAVLEAEDLLDVWQA